MLCSSLHNVFFGSIVFIPDRVSAVDHQLVMAPKRAKRGKSKAASELEVVFDQLKFLTLENEQTFETLIKHRRIGEKGKSIYMNCILLSVRIYSLGIGCPCVQTYNPFQLT